MRVADIMQSPAVSCRSDATLRAASRLMEHYNVGSVIVVGESDRIEGIVTDRDIALRAVAHERSVDTPVAEIMNRGVATIGEDDDASTAIATLTTSGHRRLPVVDGARHLVGVVTLDDLVVLLVRQLDQLCSVVAVEGANPTSLR